MKKIFFLLWIPILGFSQDAVVEINNLLKKKNL